MYFTRNPGGAASDEGGSEGIHASAGERQAAMFHPQFAIARETTEVILQRLQALPASDRTKVLGACAQDCAHETELWAVAPPTSKDLSFFARRLFVLHVEVTKLERRNAEADAEGATS
jgi:hypothetical protein